MGPDGNEDPKINRAEAQVPSVAPLGEDRVCLSGLCRAPRASGAVGGELSTPKAAPSSGMASPCAHRAGTSCQGLERWGHSTATNTPKSWRELGLSPAWGSVMSGLSLRRGAATKGGGRAELEAIPAFWGSSRKEKKQLGSSPEAPARGGIAAVLLKGSAGRGIRETATPHSKPQRPPTRDTPQKHSQPGLPSPAEQSTSKPKCSVSKTCGMPQILLPQPCWVLPSLTKCH